MPPGNRPPHQPVKLEEAVTGLAAGATAGATGACGPFAWAPLGAAALVPGRLWRQTSRPAAYWGRPRLTGAFAGPVQGELEPPRPRSLGRGRGQKPAGYSRPAWSKSPGVVGVVNLVGVVGVVEHRRGGRRRRGGGRRLYTSTEESSSALSARSRSTCRWRPRRPIGGTQGLWLRKACRCRPRRVRSGSLAGNARARARPKNQQQHRCGGCTDLTHLHLSIPLTAVAF